MTRSARRPRLGGVIHTYLGYDPKRFPPPASPPPDVVSGAFEHMLRFGSMRRLTDEELANAIHIDPSQIQGLGPSLDALIALLEERKRRILEKYETNTVLDSARRSVADQARNMHPPKGLRQRFDRGVREEQIRDLERLWYRAENQNPRFAADLLNLVERMGEKYEIETLASKYDFSGRDAMTVEQAIAIRQELEMIDELLEQLRAARENAQLAIVDFDALSEFAEPGDVDALRAMQEQVQDLVRETAERQGLEFTREGYQLTPKAMRIFQSRLLERIFADLEAARRGRHAGPITGDGAVEMPRTRPYEFGDSVAHMDMTQSLINAMIRTGGERTGPGVRMTSDDIEIHETRNTPKCATTVIMDMSGSMRYGGLYVDCKRMALALDGLIRREYPGDFLRFVEMYTFAKLRHVSELPELMPKPVTIHDPLVRLRADMSDEHITEMDVPPHFTNIQHALQLSRRLLATQDTPNRQIILITDGLPTAHFEDEQLYLLYPPHARTEEATMREAMQCAREDITINIFLLPTWSQSHEDVQFAQRMVETTKGRVFFTAGNDLDRFVVWDYVSRRRGVIG